MVTPSHGSGPQRFGIAAWIVIAIASATKLWLTACRTLDAIGWADYDDHWFLRKAISILDGRWLGPYNSMTLIKGAAYPLWIAFVSWLGIPLLPAQQLLYAFACLAVSLALAPSIRSSLARVVLFVVVLFNPMTFSDDIASRVARESVYPALGLLMFAGVAGAILRLESRRREVLPWVLLSGVSFAVFWHTREEGVWILPLVGLATAAVLWWVIIDWRERWRRGLLVVAMPALIFTAAHEAIVVTNGLRYGVFADVEFKWRPYLRAFGSLRQVRQHPPVPRVAVPEEVRRRVYAISPAFAELRPLLERDLVGWKRGAADYENDSFMWAFREAVERAGYYKRGGAAVGNYYDRLSHEIETARLAGRLDARQARASLFPPLLWGQRRAVFQTWIVAAGRVLRFADVSVTPAHSDGSDDELREYAAVTHMKLAPREVFARRVRATGWVVDVNGPLTITIERPDGTAVTDATVTRLPSPDLYEHLKQSWKEFPPARQARFDIEAPGDALLVLWLGTHKIERIPLDSDFLIAHHPDVRMAAQRFAIGRAGPPPPSRIDAFRLRVLDVIGRAYQRSVPPLFLLAALLYLPNVRWLARRRGGWMTALLIAGLISAIAARLLILSLINVTSFLVMVSGYQSPSHPLLLAAGAMMACDGVMALRTRRKT
jgi:hypothetical protein